MPVVDTLEAGLATLEELDWDLGGYVLLDSNDIGIVYDDKLDSVGEVSSDDVEGPGDGVTPGLQRIETRPVTLGLSVVPQYATKADREAAIRDISHALRLVLTPLPDRYGGQRLGRGHQHRHSAGRHHPRPRSRWPRWRGGRRRRRSARRSRGQHHRLSRRERFQRPDRR